MTATATFVALASTALMAGLWFAWAVSVIPGTRLVPDRTYVTTMQTINRAIINPGFILPFLLTPALLAVAGIAQWRGGDTRRGVLLVVAGGTYLVGVLGVTIGGNVPLKTRWTGCPWPTRPTASFIGPAPPTNDRGTAGTVPARSRTSPPSPSP